MASDRKNASNKINGSKTKGPTSPRGKRHSSQNARIWGFYAKTLVLPGENSRDWEELLAAVLEDLNPQGAIAHRLAVEIAACLWRLRRIDAAEYASLKRLAQLQVMDRKFEIRDCVASISGKKVRSDTEIDELLRTHAKELHPTAEDLSNALRTMIESDNDVAEKADRRRRAQRKEMLELLAAFHTMQERRLPPEGSVHDSESPAGGPVLSNDGARVVPFRTGGSFHSPSSGEASVDDAMITTKPDELKREAVNSTETLPTNTHDGSADGEAPSGDRST